MFKNADGQVDFTHQYSPVFEPSKHNSPECILSVINMGGGGGVYAWDRGFYSSLHLSSYKR